MAPIVRDPLRDLLLSPSLDGENLQPSEIHLPLVPFRVIPSGPRSGRGVPTSTVSRCPAASARRVLLLISDPGADFASAVTSALGMGLEVLAIHVETSPEDTSLVLSRWAASYLDCPLVVLDAANESPRRVIRDYISELDRAARRPTRIVEARRRVDQREPAWLVGALPQL